MQAGAAQVTITPPLGTELVGYGPDSNRTAERVHADLVASVLVLDDGATRVALVTCDLMGVDDHFVRAVREKVVHQTGISHLTIAASHSHTAPAAVDTRGAGTQNADYVAALSNSLTEAVADAANTTHTVTLEAGHSTHTGLAWNREGLPDVVDETLSVVKVLCEGGEVLALLVHFACHPVMLGPSTTASPDFVGGLRARLQAVYPGAAVLFLNGACADIDPVTNNDKWGSATTEQVEAAGAALGESVVNTPCAAVDGDALDVQAATLTLPYDVPSRDDLRGLVNGLGKKAQRMFGKPALVGDTSSIPPMPRFWLGYYEALLQRLDAGALPDGVTLDLQRVAIGDAVALLAVPAEVYTAQGVALKAASSYANTLVVCYANGLVGYIPPKAAFDDKRYSTTLAPAVFDRPPFQRGVAGALVEAGSALLKP